MLNPSIGELINQYESRYQLVLDVAKYARDVSEKADRDREILIEKPVDTAMDKLSVRLKTVAI